jgi:hypothetical protein
MTEWDFDISKMAWSLRCVHGVRVGDDCWNCKALTMLFDVVLEERRKRRGENNDD